MAQGVAGAGQVRTMRPRGLVVDHVFVLHTHAAPLQVARLCRILSRGCPECFILVSHDRNAPPLDRDLLPRHRLAVLPGAGGRGDFAIVDGYLSALNWLEQNDVTYKWVSNLSGQDYPVASLRAFNEHCLASDGVDAFIHHFDAFVIDPKAMVPWTWAKNEGFRRYHYYYRQVLPALSALQRALIRPCRHLIDAFDLGIHINPSYGLMLGTFVPSTPFGPTFRCHAGSFWTTINHRCATYLLSFVKERSDVVAYFRKVLIPDESFVQTVLANNRSLRLVNNNLRYIDMRASRHGRPKILTEDDLPAICSADAFFARKFDGRDQNLLEILDRRAGA